MRYGQRLMVPLDPAADARDKHHLASVSPHRHGRLVLHQKDQLRFRHVRNYRTHIYANRAVHRFILRGH